LHRRNQENTYYDYRDRNEIIYYHCQDQTRLELISSRSREESQALKFSTKNYQFLMLFGN